MPFPLLRPARSPGRAPFLAAALIAWTLFAGVPLRGQAPGPQTPGQIVGVVLDADSLPVGGVTVILTLESGATVQTVPTGATGFYRLRDVAPGRYLVQAGRLGLASGEREVELAPGATVEIDFRLVPAAVELSGLSIETTVEANRARFLREPGATVFRLEGDELRRLPGLAESDPLRAIEVLPGVVSVSDFSSAFNVRGGSADQNLILLDGVPLFNPFHLGGVFSVFNGDMVAHAELQSGGFPPRYGGRVSSVLDVESDAGTGEFRVDAGVSLLATRVAVGGSLPEGARDVLGLRRANWRVSGRRSYVDILARPAFDFPYHLQDLQGVFEGWTPGGGRLVVTGYTGKDVLDLTNLDASFPLRIFWDWGNDAVGARLVLPRPQGGSWEFRSSFSRFATGLSFPDFGDSKLDSRIRQASLAAEVERPLPGLWTLRWGGSGETLTYQNGVESGGTVFQEVSGSGWMVGTFLQADWAPSPDWLLQGGVRVDGWVPDGGDAILVPGPRLSVKRFFAGGEGALKVSTGRYSQFLHSLRDEELPLGLDIWIVAGERAPHVVSDQLQLGIEGFLSEAWFASLETYYRNYDGVITNNLAEDPNDPLDDFLGGSGRSVGVDLYVRKAGDGITGSLALSWLRADRTFPDFASGLEPTPTFRYPPIFDRRLGADLVLRVPLPGDWDGGVRWSAGSGLPYNRAVASYPFFGPRSSLDGKLVWVGTENRASGDDEDDGGQYGVLLAPRNSTRFPVYHRLDMGVRRTFRPSWGTIVPYLDVLNVYNQKNVLFYFYQFDREPATRAGISMFPVLPTIGVEVRF